MAKPKPIELPSDDFEWKDSSGASYRLHEGESVTLYQGSTVADSALSATMLAAQTRLQAAEGDPDEQQQVIRVLAEVNERICAKLADRVVAWTWTDDRGRALPQPDGTPAGFQPLRQEEVMYLWQKSCRSEPEAERKNA